MNADTRAQLVAILDGVKCEAAGWHIYQGAEGWYAVPGDDGARYHVPGWRGWLLA
jgi:hypothetical protein